MHAANANSNAITTGIPWVDALILWTLVGSIILGAGIKIWRAVVPFIRRADEVFATILGRDGTRSLDDRLDTIEHELFPNSGGSMRDAIDRVEKHMTDVDRKVVGVAENLDDHVEQSALILERGRASEQEIRKDLVEQRQAAKEREAQIFDVLKHVSEALPVVAQSTPPHEDHEEHNP